MMDFPMSGYCNREHDDQRSNSSPKTRLVWLWIVKENRKLSCNLKRDEDCLKLHKECGQQVFSTFQNYHLFGCRHSIANTAFWRMFPPSTLVWVNCLQPVKNYHPIPVVVQNLVISRLWLFSLFTTWEIFRILKLELLYHIRPYIDIPLHEPKR